MYRVADQVQHASAYGLDWMVITDHGSVAHAKIGVDKVNPDIVAARERFGDETLVFQGLEWNIPSAEHGTVFVHPGRNEVAVLKEFENAFDGVVNGTTSSRAANEDAGARRAWTSWPPASPRAGSRTRCSSPTTRPARASTRRTRSAAGASASPRIALGMEGAPGHQAAGIPTPIGAGLGPRLLRQLPDRRQLRRRTRWRATAPGAASTG